MIDVKLVLKAPPEASGFQFDFDFFSSEWPEHLLSFGRRRDQGVYSLSSSHLILKIGLNGALFSSLGRYARK